jgi:chemotaxis regulatin CheY-phosphate phosphatase CheZ
MAGLSAMRKQLAAIRSTLPQMTAFTKGRPDSDDDAKKQAAQLDQISQQLQLILRDLKSSDHLTRLLRDNLKRMPVDQRFSTAQSVEQKARDVAEATSEAQQLADLVKDLLTRNGMLSPIQAAKKTMDLIEDLEKHLPSHTQAITHRQNPLDSCFRQGMALPHYHKSTG